MGAQRVYEIQIDGHLGSSWSAWFDGLTIRHLDRGETVLSGPLADQAALHGVLLKIRDLNLPLLEVKQLVDGETEFDTDEDERMSGHGDQSKSTP